MQAIVLLIADRHTEYARTVLAKLKDAGIRADIDERSEKVNAKIREAQLAKISYMLVIGAREAEQATVGVRHRKHADLAPNRWKNLSPRWLNRWPTARWTTSEELYTAHILARATQISRRMA